MRSRAPRRRHLTAALATATVLTMLSVTGISMADESGTADPLTTLISRADLINQRDKIFADLEAREIPGMDGFSVGISTIGRLGVTVFIPPGKGAKSILGRLGAKSISLGLGANVDVKIVPSDGLTELANAGGGVEYFTEDGGNCTAGFTVIIKGGTVFDRGDKQGIVTAGHCFKPGLATKKNSSGWVPWRAWVSPAKAWISPATASRSPTGITTTGDS